MIPRNLQLQISSLAHSAFVMEVTLAFPSVTMSTAETIAAIFRGSILTGLELLITLVISASGTNRLTSGIRIFPKITMRARMVKTVIIPTANSINAVLNASFMIFSLKDPANVRKYRG